MYKHQGVTRRRKRRIFEFNPNSHVHLKEIYFESDYYNMPILETTDTGAPSTKASVMKALADEYDIVKYVRSFKLMTKAVGTYLEPAATRGWSSGDGRVRSTYNLHGTRTGRLSSSNPNMQNIPTPEKEPGTILEVLPIKNIFTHTFADGYLLAVDYSGMELRVFASLANCSAMLDIHRSGKDFHSMVALMARDGMNIDDISYDMIADFRKHENHVRYRYKWTNWTLLYGGDKFTLINLYGMTQEEADDTITRYYGGFPEVLEFRKYCTSFATEHGYIESPFGRRELLPYRS